jgi:DNA-binding NarL/FixJ family response regulator
MIDIKNITEDPISALVVAKPGLMRNSLVAYLRGVSAIETVALANDTLSALLASRKYHPKVLLMDAEISEEETLWLMRQLRCEQTQVNFIVLIDHLHQQQLFIDAGADQVLLKGFLDERLRRAVLRQEKERDQEQPTNRIGPAQLAVQT